MIANVRLLDHDDLTTIVELTKRNGEIYKHIRQSESLKRNLPFDELDDLTKEGIQNLLTVYGLIEKAELMELQLFRDSPDHMLGGALIQVTRAVQFLTNDFDPKEQFWLKRFGANIVIKDFEKCIRDEVDSFIASLYEYPDKIEEIDNLIKAICKDYPSQMICYPKNYPEREEDVLKYELGEPIRETENGYIYAYKEFEIDDTVHEEESPRTEKERKPRKARAKNVVNYLDATLPSQMIFPLDKVNTLFWSGNIPIDGKAHKIGIEKENSEKKGDIIVIAGIKELLTEAKGKLSINLTEYDASVWLALANAAYYNKRELTIPQVYALMGGKTRAKKEERTKIINSFMKLLDGTIFIDNREETDKEKLGYKYPTFYGKAQLIQGEIIVSNENNMFKMGGQAVDCVIRLGDVPYLFRFAQERNQIATVPLSVLQTPLRLTEKNLKLRDYIIKRLCRIKDNSTILMSTICQNCGITDRSSKSRIVATLSKLLNYYKNIGFIKSYKIIGDKIIVHRQVQEVKEVETEPKRKKKK